MFNHSSVPQSHSTDSPSSLQRNPKIRRQTGTPVASVTASDDFADPSPSPLKRSYRPFSRALDSQGVVPKSRRRFTSMPQPLPSELQARIDIDNDRIARGLASPPIVDFTRLEDTYRGPRDEAFESLLVERMEPKIKPILKRNRSSSVGPLNTRTTFSPLNLSHDRKPDPRLIVAALEQVLNLGPQSIGEHLDIHELLGMHQLDQLNFEERDAIMAQMVHGGRRALQDLAVFGEHLRKVSIYASIKMVLGGREHELPIVVVSAVEELYRTGIYQHNLFRTLPNRARLLQLIGIFDSQRQPPESNIGARISSQEVSNPPSGFGADTSLHLETTPDVCALLSTYLASLPEPILLPTLFRAVWDWCGLAEEETDPNNDLHGRRLSSFAPAGTYTNDTESTRIKTAQLLLHLLPSPNFSLLVYLLSFFSQVVLIREENGVGVEDLGRMFGGKIFGGGTIRKHQGGERRREGEVMMCWFMSRWGLISEGLFDVVEELKSRKESGDAHAKAESLGWMPPSVSPGDLFGSSPPLSPSTLNLPFISTWEPEQSPSSHLSPTARPSSAEPFLPPHDVKKETNRSAFVYDDYRHSATVQNQVTIPPEAGINFEGRDHQLERSERKFREPDTIQSVFLAPSPASSNDRIDVCSAQDISSDAASIYSAPALDERLLDICLPSATEAMSRDPSTSVPTPRPSSASTNSELSQARSHILSLELKLKMTELLVAESAQEAAKATEKVVGLESRLKGLELMTKGGDGGRVDVAVGADTGDDEMGCGGRLVTDGDVVPRAQLAMALEERDMARRLVADIRDLIKHQTSV